MQLYLAYLFIAIKIFKENICCYNYKAYNSNK